MPDTLIQQSLVDVFVISCMESMLVVNLYIFLPEAFWSKKTKFSYSILKVAYSAGNGIYLFDLFD